MMDRGGLVGNDGATHHGNYDLAYLACIPDIVIMAPSDEAELQNMIETAYNINDCVSAVRYPRASGLGAEKLLDLFGTTHYTSTGELPPRGTSLPIGKGRVVKQAEAKDKKIKVCILSLGSRLADSVLAARALESKYNDIAVTVADARFMKPLDEELIRSLAQTNDVMVTIEEGSKGGFGDYVLNFLANDGLLDNGDLKVRSMYIPDIWIEAGSQKEQYAIAGIDEAHIISKVEDVAGSIRQHRLRNVVTVDSVPTFPSSATATTLGSAMNLS